MSDMDLNNVMEFDHVIEVHVDGSVTDAPTGIWGPELCDGELLQGGTAGTGWTLMNGYSGQYNYRGPIMHASEFIGGKMAHDILSEPGFYVALTDNADGWAVARKDSERRCAACGGRFHNPTWGCIRPTLAEGTS